MNEGCTGSFSFFWFPRLTLSCKGGRLDFGFCVLVCNLPTFGFFPSDNCSDEPDLRILFSKRGFSWDPFLFWWDSSDMDEFSFGFLKGQSFSLAALFDPNIYKRLEERLSRILLACDNSKLKKILKFMQKVTLKSSKWMNGITVESFLSITCLPSLPCGLAWAVLGWQWARSITTATTTPSLMALLVVLTFCKKIYALLLNSREHRVI